MSADNGLKLDLNGIEHRRQLAASGATAVGDAEWDQLLDVDVPALIRFATMWRGIEVHDGD